MLPKEMVYYVDENGVFWDQVHNNGYKVIPKEWIENWKSRGVNIIIYDL